MLHPGMDGPCVFPLQHFNPFALFDRRQKWVQRLPGNRFIFNDSNIIAFIKDQRSHIPCSLIIVFQPQLAVGVDENRQVLPVLPFPGFIEHPAFFDAGLLIIRQKRS